MRVFSLVLLLNLVACTTGTVTRLQNAELVEYQSPALLTDIPFFPQDAYQCGPAALATVLSASNQSTVPDELVDEVYVPARQGSLQIEMLASTRRHGRIPYLIDPDLASLMDEVRNGRPVLVLQNLGLGWFPRWHYAVVIGYDLAGEELVLHSGLRRNYELNMNVFERTWNRSEHWGFVVLTPGELPAGVDEIRYLEAVAAFEPLADFAAVEAAYLAGIRRWPDSFSLNAALGNSYYSQGMLQDAAERFRQVTTQHPDSADGHNNLAFVLSELGEYQAAMDHAGRAIAIGGSRIELYRETLRQIQQAMTR
ncbi:MAG: PA2778 family cysteine peptidase [Pseudohongiellaceae bacterium]